jgi:hypothetical protein
VEHYFMTIPNMQTRKMTNTKKNLPLCFILMPFGKKPSGNGTIIDFDAIYYEIIKPATVEAGLSPIRADEEQVGGIIHKPMFERLMLCDYAIADLTIANANVYYELGIRHAIRTRSTVLVFAENTLLPFDLGLLRGLPYKLTPQGMPENVPEAIEALKNKIIATKNSEEADSPIFKLVEGYGEPDIKRLKTDVFRNQVEISSQIKEDLAIARSSKENSLGLMQNIQSQLGRIRDADSGVIIDLFLSYRAVGAHKQMIDLVEKMSPPLARTVLVQEQLAFALNREKRRNEAERLLVTIIEENGPSSETNGLLGRVYKDQWEEALNSGKKPLTMSLQKKCVNTYLNGFESDWRDAYPGINAVTMMEFSNKKDHRQAELLTVVEYSVKQRLKGGKPDYWDHATLLELAVLKNDEEQANEILLDVLTSIREYWEPETTCRNLSLIHRFRLERKENTLWLEDIIEALQERIKELRIKSV